MSKNYIVQSCEQNLHNYNSTVIGASYSIMFSSELKLEIALILEVGCATFDTFSQETLQPENGLIQLNKKDKTQNAFQLGDHEWKMALRSSYLACASSRLSSVMAIICCRISPMSCWGWPRDCCFLTESGSPTSACCSPASPVRPVSILVWSSILSKKTRRFPQSKNTHK